MKTFWKSVNKTGAGFLLLTPPLAVLFTYWHIKQDGFMWQIWALAAVFYVLTNASITTGYHRLFAHKAYEAKPWVRWALCLFGAAAFQNSILIWARDHRVHHRFVDTDADPYSINKGFFHAHFGWMLFDYEQPVKAEPYGRDLERDKMIMWQHRNYIVVASFMCFVLPMILGYFLGSALGGLAVAGLVRVVLAHHATFLINSYAHTWGKQTYTDENSAKDSLICAILTFGEGYHNFHHIFANDYRNGVRWYHWDPTKWTIRGLAMIGATYELRRVPQAEIMKRRLEMEEKQLKRHLNHAWQQQFQQQIDNLKVQVEAAYRKWEALREEYKKVAKDFANASRERLDDLKAQMRAAKMELRAAMQQWRAYNSFLLAGAPA